MSHDPSLEVVSLAFYDSVKFQLFILSKIYDDYGIFAIQVTY